MKINFVIDVKRLYFLADVHIYIPLWNSNLNVYRKDNNWLYLLFKTNFVPSPHTKFRLNKKMTNYNHFTSIDISK